MADHGVSVRTQYYIIDRMKVAKPKVAVSGEGGIESSRPGELIDRSRRAAHSSIELMDSTPAQGGDTRPA